MLDYNTPEYLPSSEELPCSDDTPVDNELQNLIPNLLKAILALIWQDRWDWFFGVDMGIYDRTGQIRRTPIIPDGFLSLGVPRRKNDPKGRLSYVLLEENNIAPILVLELVSQTYGKEYEEKINAYARLGVLYYVIYNPEYYQRDKHQPFEVYRLENGVYLLCSGEPVWMPEIGLGIGRGQGVHEGWQREWLYWFDEQGNRFPTPEEVAQQQSFRAQQERQQRELAEQQAAEMQALLQRYRDRFGELSE
ncbi:Uma2 family endonuclease [Scytonema hofmannii FACHB-248]|uniref:Uma2 family endonuclease n=1 Tax=Scytonema hofmannii FACHB-248 TaxID=1842502 RepID=A0ABR8GJQ1_9CYAN|nr:MULTISPECIES: Uma2 family endonuclease [Nostocales]MBD2603617.1 Uma2 family endonuclease [Scytonema hofmannii FACHB-248]